MQNYEWEDRNEEECSDKKVLCRDKGRVDEEGRSGKLFSAS